MLKSVPYTEAKKQFNVYYSDYAPSLIPEKYIGTIAIDKDNSFLIIDLCCCAEPYCTTVTKQLVLEKNTIEREDYKNEHRV